MEDQWREMIHWNDPYHDDCIRLTVAVDAADGFDTLCGEGARVDKPEHLEPFENHAPYEVCHDDGKFYWRFLDAEQDDTQRAAADRWHLLQAYMAEYNEIPPHRWPELYRIITELHAYRQTGQLDWRTEEEMERRGL
jgi:hypothetical protein